MNRYWHKFCWEVWEPSHHFDQELVHEYAMHTPCRGIPRVSKWLSFSLSVVRNFRTSNIWGGSDIVEESISLTFEPGFFRYLPWKLLSDDLVPVVDWTSWWLPSRKSQGDFVMKAVGPIPWGHIGIFVGYRWDFSHEIGYNGINEGVCGHYMCVHYVYSYSYIYI